MTVKWLLLDKTKPLRKRVELLYEGEFAKLDASGDGVEFAVTPGTLDHFQRKVREFRELEIPIPLAKSHVGWEKPENKYGDVVDLLREKNDKGKESSFIVVDFKDEKSMKEATATGVSAGIPEKFFDGFGNEHVQPLVHVAATNAPIIPALSGWTCLSHTLPSSRKSSMWEKQIAELGITVAEDATDDQKETAVMAGIQALKSKNVELSREEETPEDETVGNAGDVELGRYDAPPMVVRQVKNARKTRIDLLLSGDQPRITAARHKELMNRYASDDVIKLELSHGGDGEDFDFLMNTLTDKLPIPKTGRKAVDVGDNGVELSHGNEPVKGALAKKMKLKKLSPNQIRR